MIIGRMDIIKVDILSCLYRINECDFAQEFCSRQMITYRGISFVFYCIWSITMQVNV